MPSHPPYIGFGHEIQVLVLSDKANIILMSSHLPQPPLALTVSRQLCQQLGLPISASLQTPCSPLVPDLNFSSHCRFPLLGSEVEATGFPVGTWASVCHLLGGPRLLAVSGRVSP